MASLLGQFFTRISGSQEDIASEGLAYILNSSTMAKSAINIFINTRTGIALDRINYLTQSTGKNNERPDISGIDENGEEKIIIEAKFWASLTGNQPVEYLNRLKSSSVLIFICPSLRENSLSNEIETRLNTAGIDYTLNDKVFKLDEKYIIIANWFEVLLLLKSTLTEGNERLLVSDVDQLIGFCEKIDTASFLPIMGTDLSPAYARRINSYCDLVDKITDRLVAIGNASLQGMRAAPQKYGYTRYLLIGKYGVALDVDMKMWELYVDTPFWVLIKYYKSGQAWEQPDELKKRLKEVSVLKNMGIYQTPRGNDLSIAIVPRIDAVEDEVIEDIVNSIKSLIEKL